MDKIIEKLLVEYLIPSILMCFCLILIFDIFQGDNFNLYQLNLKFSFNALELFILVVFSYILNTSLSSLFNYYSRFLLWGRVREYLIYRKLDIFKESNFKGMNTGCLSYVFKREYFDSRIDGIKKNSNRNLYKVLMEELDKNKVPEESRKSILDIYEIVRTLVMASKDSSIIEWIKYHWDQLRLARSTIIPAFMLVFITPFLLIDWKCDVFVIILGTLLSLLFFVLQYFHYYYRERFMIYTMFGYYLTCNK